MIRAFFSLIQVILQRLSIHKNSIYKKGGEPLDKALEIKQLKAWTRRLVLLIVCTPLSIIPFIHWFGLSGLIGTALFFIAAAIATYKIEIIKKRNHLKTPQDISAFYTGNATEQSAPSHRKVRIIVFTTTFLIVGAIAWISFSTILG